MAIQSNPVTLGKVLVASAGTPVPLTNNFTSNADISTLKSNKIDIQALKSNAGKIYLGYGSTMDKSTGVSVMRELDPGESWSITEPAGINVFDVFRYYIDADTSGDGIYASAHVR